MDDPRDKTLRDGSVIPLGSAAAATEAEEERGLDPSDNGRQASTSGRPSQLSPPPLTHRQRGFARLAPTAVKTAAQRPGSDSAGADNLRPLSDQLVAIAQQLRSGEYKGAAPSHRLISRSDQADIREAELAGSSETHFEPTQPGGGFNEHASRADESGEDQQLSFARMARASYARRRKRAKIFGDSELFGEPAWDILLDLYIAQAEGNPVSVSSACIGSAAPPTTGLRWLGVLADHDLVQREHDPDDQRRVLVRLTEKALTAMDEYFASSAGLSADRREARA